jgi:hypothetical protein
MKHHETLNSPVALKAGHLCHFRVFTLAPPLEHLWNGMDEKSCHHHLSGGGVFRKWYGPQQKLPNCVMLNGETNASVFTKHIIFVHIRIYLVTIKC